jgi:hypothetical protein
MQLPFKPSARSSRQSAPILQQWSEQIRRRFEAGQAMKPWVIQLRQASNGAAGPASLVWAGAIALSWLPRLAHNFARRFGALAAPGLGFLDTDDSTSAKLHRARRQSCLLQLIEKREANADGGAELLD